MITVKATQEFECPACQVDFDLEKLVFEGDEINCVGCWVTTTITAENAPQIQYEYEGKMWWGPTP